MDLDRCHPAGDFELRRHLVFYSALSVCWNEIWPSVFWSKKPIPVLSKWFRADLVWIEFGLIRLFRQRCGDVVYYFCLLVFRKVWRMIIIMTIRCWSFLDIDALSITKHCEGAVVFCLSFARGNIVLLELFRTLKISLCGRNHLLRYAPKMIYLPAHAKWLKTGAYLLLMLSSVSWAEPETSKHGNGKIIGLPSRKALWRSVSHLCEMLCLNWMASKDGRNPPKRFEPRFNLVYLFWLSKPNGWQEKPLERFAGDITIFNRFSIEPRFPPGVSRYSSPLKPSLWHSFTFRLFHPQTESARDCICLEMLKSTLQDIRILAK